MKKLSYLLWGVTLTVLGTLFCLHILDVVNLSVLWEGWWCLFLIVPSFINLITQKGRVFSLMILIFGVLLFLACHGTFPFSTVWKTLPFLILVAVGVQILVHNFFRKKWKKTAVHTETQFEKEHCATYSGTSGESYSSTLRGDTVNFDGQIFRKTALKATLGGIVCDLRNATVEDGAVVEVNCKMGGIDLLLPPGLKLILEVRGTMGGVENRYVSAVDGTAPTLTVRGHCTMGGVEIR